MLNHIRNPDLFHGRNKKKGFFEGWYYKLVDEERGHACIIIPGINFGSGQQDAHSFIQMYDTETEIYEYARYSPSDFQASKNEFSFSVGPSTFSYKGLTLDIEGNRLHVHGRLCFSKHMKWPDSIWSPGSMGYYNYIPFMECYSQVCVMDMSVSGYLEINNIQYDFSSGKGYIEKNWGKSFPLGWIWVQCNQFTESSVSLSASIGHIPFITGSFRGFLIGIWVRNNFYSFSTLNKSRLHVSRKDRDVSFKVENRRHKLDIVVNTNPFQFTTLMGPKRDMMVPLVDETIQGKITIRLTNKKYNSIILMDEGRFAGVEFGGQQRLVFNN